MSAYSWSSIAGSALAGCSAVVIFSASCSDIISTAITRTHDVRSEIKNAKSRRGNDASNTALLTEDDSLRGRRIGGTHGRFEGGERYCDSILRGLFLEHKRGRSKFTGTSFLG